MRVRRARRLVGGGGGGGSLVGVGEGWGWAIGLGRSAGGMPEDGRVCCVSCIGPLAAAGQWVAWKQPGDKAAAGGDLFVSGSFYNLLCPQRPTTV